jgi:hypothetical protein
MSDQAESRDGIMAALVEMGFTPEQAAAYSLRSGAKHGNLQASKQASNQGHKSHACPLLRD